MAIHGNPHPGVTHVRMDHYPVFSEIPMTVVVNRTYITHILLENSTDFVDVYMLYTGTLRFKRREFFAWFPEWEGGN